MHAIPLIVSPQWLTSKLHENADKCFLADISKLGVYAQAHLHGAVHIDYKFLQGDDFVAPGLPPSKAEIEQLLSAIGLTPDQHVIAYDEEGGTRAARFLWILALAGHKNYSYLDGGIHAWLDLNLPYTDQEVLPTPSNYTIDALREEPIVDFDYVFANYDKPNTILWDSRSAEEYAGILMNARRVGHIPGAVNYNWENAIDRGNNNLLRSEEAIRQELLDLGITPDKEVIVYCRTHHRSCFTWLLAKHLGYDNVRGYAGSWAEWSSRDDTPIATAEIDVQDNDEFELPELG